MSTTPPDGSWDGPGSGHPSPGNGYPPPPPGGYPPPPPPGGFAPPPPGYGPPGFAPGQFGPGPGAKGYTPYGEATGWWQRVGATIVDGLVLVIPNVILQLILGRVAGDIVVLLVQGAYTVILLSLHGQTVGNRAAGTRVVSAETGQPLSAGRALGRWGAQLLFTVLAIVIIPVLLDWLWPLWDQNRQTLHDKMAGTLVLKTQ